MSGRLNKNNNGGCMKKTKLGVLCSIVLFGGSSFYSYADLDISGNSDITVTEDGGEIIFDKSANSVNSTSSGGGEFLNSNKSRPTNRVELTYDDAATPVDGGDGDQSNESSSLSQSEIDNIEASGGEVIVSPRKAPSSDGFIDYDKAMGGVPLNNYKGSYLKSLDDAINRTSSDVSSVSKPLPVMRLGYGGYGVDILSQRLVDKGYLDLAGQALPEVYDEDIVAAVKLAQKDLNLTVDGVAGPQLYSNLGLQYQGAGKVSKQDLLSWKEEVLSLMTQASDEGYSKMIIVNVPSYTLHAIDVSTGNVELESKVIVGKAIHQTPIYRMNLTGLKYNPNWTPPMSVIKRSVLPNLQSGSGYIRSHQLQAVDSQGRKYPLSSVSASDILSGRYRVQQPPGTNNSLGILKFETDSADNIYLHDTNQRYLFNQTNRALSLGCIRVQQWTKLAEFVSNKDEETLKNNLKKGKTYIERVDKVPVFITYSLTDVVGGVPGYYKDIYNKK